MNEGWRHGQTIPLRRPSGRVGISGKCVSSLMVSANAFTQDEYDRDPVLLQAVSWWIFATFLVLMAFVSVSVLLGFAYLIGKR